MKIGIDISQLAYPNTGVANYLEKLVEHLVRVDKENEYVLFFSSMRGQLDSSRVRRFMSSRVAVKKFRFPPTLLDLLWNKLHIFPIENLIGEVDVFITSDWTEPPAKFAKKVTILYDLVVYKHPGESTEKIVSTQKRKLAWMKKESAAILCISEATKKDAEKILGIEEKRLKVVYPGVL
jgi:hypothetical protein